MAQVDVTLKIKRQSARSYSETSNGAYTYWMKPANWKIQIFKYDKIHYSAANFGVIRWIWLDDSEDIFDPKMHWN